MRNLLIWAALTTVVVLGAAVQAGAAPSNTSARSNNANKMALAECQRQARAKRFGKLAVQRRNFLKECMIDRGFYGQTN
jgi:hypothetical protein